VLRSSALTPSHPRAERAYRIAAAALIALGIVFRSMRYWFNPIALWGDEAVWARNLLERPLTMLEFRPIGLMAVTKWLTELTAVDERVLRLPCYLAGIASLFLALWVGRMLFARRLTVLVLVGFVAVSPILVDFSREFKPYSVEVALHLLLLGIGLRYWRTRARGWLIALIVTAPIAFLLAYNAVFAYPVPFGLALLDRWRAPGRRGLDLVVGGAVGCIAFIGLVYATVISQIDAPDEAGFWGQKYDAFYLPPEHGAAALDHLRWVVRKTADVAAMPGAIRALWRPPSSLPSGLIAAWSVADYWVWLALVLGGAAWLARRRRYAALGLLVGPLAVAFLFNLLGRWPWSAFRVNVFFLAYLFPLAGVAIDALLDLPLPRLRAAAIGAILLVVGWPQIGFGWGLRTMKRAWVSHAEFPALLARVRADRERALAEDPGRPRDLLLTDRYGCAPIKFYLYHHSITRAEDGAFVLSNFDLRCFRGSSEIAAEVEGAEGRPVWIAISGPKSRRSLPRRIRRFAEITRSETIADSHLLMIVRAAP
jgi:hypothetical protein